MANEKNEIKAGDVVTLKSGGPKMTVEEVVVDQGRTICPCTWFINVSGAYSASTEIWGEKRQDDFRIEALVKVEVA